MPKTKPYIIVVEDDSLLGEMYQLRLKLAGYRAVLVRHKEELDEVLAKKVPDLIILDILLPGVNGLAILKDLRTHDRTHKVPAVILTNLARTESSLAPDLASSLNIAAYLVKSQTTADKLVQVVEYTLAKIKK